MTNGQYIRVSADLEIYYEEAGSGPPLIFIPGWAGTTEFYKDQMAYFRRKYRVITFDPRSQGRTSKTLENNHYVQHGKDLEAFLNTLDLTDVVLVALSWGCLDVYAYIRLFGTDKLEACVFIDETPCAIAKQQDDWSDFVDHIAAVEFINAIVYDYRGLLEALITPMMKRAITRQELDWAVDQLLKTPNYAAALLAVDGSFADYTEEAKEIDGRIPVLNILSEDQAAPAKAWLAKNAPHSETFVLGKHLMLLEFPDQFNVALAEFLEKYDSRKASANLP